MNSYFALLTAPGTAAIATFAIWGPEAWPIIRRHFQPASQKPLPEVPTAGRTWFGRIGSELRDEVILIATQIDPLPAFEIHCHGGQVVQKMLSELFESSGIVPVDAMIWLNEIGYQSKPNSEHAVLAWQKLPNAPTQRTAGILLDQTTIDKAEANRFASLGRHLTTPWKVAIVGAPNVGKSSLINALAGYQRSVVAPIPGTTRDLVSVQIALDGWPIELTDTAGLRETADEIESEGIRRAKRVIEESDLVLWMTDSEHWAEEVKADISTTYLKIVNKIDLVESNDWKDWVPISARTGQGVPELIALVVARLVPEVPKPGEAVSLEASRLT